MSKKKHNSKLGIIIQSLHVSNVFISSTSSIRMGWRNICDQSGENRHFWVICPKENLTSMIHHYMLNEINRMAMQQKQRLLVRAPLRRMCSVALCRDHCIFSIIHKWLTQSSGIRNIKTNFSFLPDISMTLVLMVITHFLFHFKPQRIFHFKTYKCL